MQFVFVHLCKIYACFVYLVLSSLWRSKLTNQDCFGFYLYSYLSICINIVPNRNATFLKFNEKNDYTLYFFCYNNKIPVHVGPHFLACILNIQELIIQICLIVIYSACFTQEIIKC